jgi:hypothetical protein
MIELTMAANVDPVATESKRMLMRIFEEQSKNKFCELQGCGITLDGTRLCAVRASDCALILGFAKV